MLKISSHDHDASPKAWYFWSASRQKSIKKSTYQSKRLAFSGWIQGLLCIKIYEDTKLQASKMRRSRSGSVELGFDDYLISWDMVERRSKYSKGYRCWSPQHAIPSMYLWVRVPTSIFQNSFGMSCLPGVLHVFGATKVLIMGKQTGEEGIVYQAVEYYKPLGGRGGTGIGHGAYESIVSCTLKSLQSQMPQVAPHVVACSLNSRVSCNL